MNLPQELKSALFDKPQENKNDHYRFQSRTKNCISLIAERKEEVAKTNGISIEEADIALWKQLTHQVITWNNNFFPHTFMLEAIKQGKDSIAAATLDVLEETQSYCGYDFNISEDIKGSGGFERQLAEISISSFLDDKISVDNLNRIAIYFGKKEYVFGASMFSPQLLFALGERFTPENCGFLHNKFTQTSGLKGFDHGLFMRFSALKDDRSVLYPLSSSLANSRRPLKEFHKWFSIMEVFEKDCVLNSNNCPMEILRGMSEMKRLFGARRVILNDTSCHPTLPNSTDEMAKIQEDFLDTTRHLPFSKDPDGAKMKTFESIFSSWLEKKTMENILGLEKPSNKTAKIKI